MKSMRKWDSGSREDAEFTSSDDDEMSRLKPKDLNVTMKSNHHYKLHGSSSGSSSAAGSAGRSRATGSQGIIQSAGRNNYFLGAPLITATSGSGATSPNDSDNTYAEASLMAHHAQIIDPQPATQSSRIDQDYDEYDNELYANGALEAQQQATNHRYHQITQHLQKQPRSPVEGRQQSGSFLPTRNFAGHLLSLQNSESKSPFLGGSSCSSRTNGRSSSSMASTVGRRGGGGGGSSSGGSGGTTSTTVMPPMLPSDPPGNRRHQTGQQHLVSDRGWDTQSSDLTSMLETRIGPDPQHVQSATMMAADKRNRNKSFNIKTATLHGASLAEDSLSTDKSAGQPLHHQVQSMTSPDPIVMPGFPVRTIQTHPPPPYSPSREKFGLGKRCHFHCSWKLVALALTFLTIILSSVIAYFGAVKYPGSMHSSPAFLPPDSLASDQHSIECAQVTEAQGGQPQAVIPHGGSGFANMATDSSVKANPAMASATASAPTTLIAGQWYTVKVEPMTFWRGKMNVRQSGYYQMNLTVISSDGFGRIANLAIYGRQGQAPSITNYDWVHMISQSGESRSMVKRSAASHSLISVDKLLSPGDWFVAVFNDDDADACTIRSVIGQKRYSKSCLNECNGRGICDDGFCRCFPQFTGSDCSQSVCPLLCSGHGVYGGGQCHCVDGWKGAECDVKDTECIFPDCSNHGHCQEGVCICKQGWTGDHCNIKDCDDRKCSGHGICQDGHCLCDIGWMGKNCDKRNEVMFQCLPDCSGHGDFHVDQGKCLCKPQWTGRDCNITVCSLDCGPHGSCQGSSCVCHQGWQGALCTNKSCDERCALNGQCNDGVCECRHGFHGRHCTLEACGPQANCNLHGSCEAHTNPELPFRCRCESGWSGSYCETSEETDCTDNIDNDGNGMVDCSDSKCCSHEGCKKSLMCLHLADPVEVLQRKPLSQLASSFLRQVQFLFDGDDNVQNYAKPEMFDERRVSVIRGRVITINGQGIIGVRVSVDRTRDATNFGFTITRPGGWFDMAVNGGGGVTLQFQRSPLKATTRTTFVSWNQIVIINPVVMTSHGSAGGSLDELSNPIKVRYFQPCLDHEYETISPQILTSHQSYWTSAPSPLRGGGIFPESQIVYESIRLPGTDVALIYRSSGSAQFMSTVSVRLTPSRIPDTLVQIHLVFRVAGTMMQKKLEADANLSYTFSWNKLNAYHQKVFGIVTAQVSVGYEYRSCSHPIWWSETTTLKGFDVDVSHLGGWNLNIHHHYNHYQGILQKGDGSWWMYRNFAPVMKKVIGQDGLQRKLECPRSQCEGMAKALSLLKVLSIVSGPNGSVYVGDFNLVRKITPNGHVSTILQFPSNQDSYEYDLSWSPADNCLFVAHSKKHQIWRVDTVEPEKVKDPLTNWKRVVGTGERCVPPGNACGDGQLASEARLDFPKSVAVSVDRTMFISDGRRIRLVSPDGIIHTLIGDPETPFGPAKPLSCGPVFNMADFWLNWPTKLAINPIDNSLHIMDDMMVLRVTPEMRLQLIAGSSQMCPNSTSPFTSALVSMDFAADGSLIIAEHNRLHKWNPDGQLEDVDCHSCAKPVDQIVSVASNPDGSVYAAADKGHQIVRFSHVLPEADINGHVRVADTVAKQIYTFNIFGQHLFTHNLDTGRRMYIFEYSKNINLGTLTSVQDELGNKIYIDRDYSNKAQSIQTPLGLKLGVLFSEHGCLESLQASDSSAKLVHLSYKSDVSGLLESKHFDNGDFTLYEYDGMGKATATYLSHGSHFEVERDLQQECLPRSAACFQVHKNGELAFKLTMDRNETTISPGGNSCSVNVGRSASSELQMRAIKCGSRRSQSVWLKSDHPTMRHLEAGLSGLQLMPSKVWRSNDQGTTIFSMSWSFEEEQQPITQLQPTNGAISRSLWMSENNPLLHIRYKSEGDEESVRDGHGRVLMSVSYKNGLLPAQWTFHLHNNCSQTTDRFNRPTRRGCDQYSESFTYSEKNGKLEEIQRCEKRPTRWTYSDANFSSKPRDIILPSGRRYSYDYDDRGGLMKIKFPKDSAFLLFELQTGLFGKVKLLQTLPGFKEPHICYFDEEGRLVQIRPANMGNNGMTLIRYYSQGSVRSVASGDYITQYQYQPDGQLRQVNHETDRFSFTLTRSFPPPATSQLVAMEESISFDARSGFASAHITYGLENGLKHLTVSGRIGGQSFPRNFVQHAWSDEGIAAKDIGRFYLHLHNLNESSLSDGVATFSKSSNFEALTISGREVYRADYSRDLCGRIQLLRQKIVRTDSATEMSQEMGFKYDEDGQLESITSDRAEHRYVYDDNGNLLSHSWSWSGGGVQRNAWELDAFGRLVKQKGHRFLYEYDSQGRTIVDGHRNILTYLTSDVVDTVEVANSNGLRVTYFYDHLNRLIGRKDSLENSTQFFYAFLHRPYLVSHIYEARRGTMTSLLYDNQDRLIFAQLEGRRYYVVTDQLGSPCIFITPTGKIVREISRDPYGLVNFDSDKQFGVPIGFYGAIYDPVTDLHHFQRPGGSVAYDANTGSFLAPQWRLIMANLFNPLTLRTYRFPGNDPINRQNILIPGPKDLLDKIGMHLELAFPLLKEPFPLGRPQKMPSFLSQLSSNEKLSSWPGILSTLSPVVPASLFQFYQDIASADSLSFVQPSSLMASSSPDKEVQISRRDSPLGKFITISKTRNNSVLVKSVPFGRTNEVAREVFASVLNGAILVDFQSALHADNEAYFFVKEQLLQASEDIKALHRLGPLINLTTHDTQTESGITLDVRLHLDNVLFSIRYGDTASNEKSRLLRHSFKSLVRRAWAKEKEALLVSSSIRLSYNWQPEQKKQLTHKGFVDGMEVSVKRDIQAYPELANDLLNVRFVKSNASKLMNSQQRKHGYSPN